MLDTVLKFVSQALEPFRNHSVSIAEPDGLMGAKLAWLVCKSELARNMGRNKGRSYR